MTRRILVVSVAGLTPGDLTGPVAPELGALRSLVTDGSAQPLAPVRPDTAASWSAALMTGMLPEQTGITADVSDPATTHDRPRVWTADDLLADSLFSAARTMGARTAALGLPLTADPEHRLAIEWLCPDVTDVPRWGSFAMLDACSSPAVRELLPRLRQRIQQLRPTTRDEIFTDLAVEILEQDAPDLTIVHLTELAAARREGGLDSAGARDALLATDRRLGRLVAAVRQAGDALPPVVLVASGGVQTQVLRQVHLNTVLRERGFLQASAVDRTDGWEAFALSCGASSRIVLAQSIQPRRVLQLESLLAEFADQPANGIVSVTPRDRLGCPLHVDPRTGYLAEGAPGTCFGDSWSKRPVVLADDPYYDGPRAMSGNTDGGAGVLLVSGLHSAAQPVSVLDLAPTLAELLGTTLPGTAGRPLLQLDGVGT